MEPSPRKILAATDLSPASDEALRQASARARSAGAEIAVCLAIPGELGVHPLFPHHNQAEAEAMGRRRVQAEEALRARVSDLVGDESVELFIESGWPHVQVLRIAEDWGADPIVVGARGGTGLARMLLGSTAERIMRHAHCPVLIARPAGGGGRIVVGTDFSDPALPAVHAAAAEARRTGGAITIVHAIEDLLLASGYPGPGLLAPLWIGSPELRREMEQAARQRLADALASAGATGVAEVGTGGAAAVLVATAEQLDADLVVVGTAGRTGLRRMLLGSVAESVARLAPCSVLVVRLGAPAL